MSASLLQQFTPLLTELRHLKHVIVSRAEAGAGHPSLSSLLSGGQPEFEPAQTSCDDPCFRLYSFGATGVPKGTIHVHASLIQTAELYARPIAGIRENDIVFSAPKLFFAYGLEAALISHPAVLEAAVIGQEDGDGLTKPLACVVLEDQVQPDEGLSERLKQHVKGLLAPHKYPRRIQFLSELPKTATGKIQRFKLRELYGRRAD